MLSYFMDYKYKYVSTALSAKINTHFEPGGENYYSTLTGPHP